MKSEYEANQKRCQHSWRFAKEVQTHGVNRETPTGSREESARFQRVQLASKSIARILNTALDKGFRTVHPLGE